MKKIAYLFLLLQLMLSTAWAQESFVVQRIQFQGLQRVSVATVESYLPIKRGQYLDSSRTGAILRSLYQTGFFDHITLSRENGTLIIHVVERPTIGQLKISGNSIIPTDKLTTVMRSLDIAEGRVYNPVILEKITQGLLNQYYMLGRYNARVDVQVTPMSRNRVLVKINISEGLVAKVRRISIIGNKVFPESTLINQLDLSTSGFFTFVTQSDRYSEEKLESSLDKLRGYYMDRGYLRFEVKSAQAQVTPDRKSIFVTIVVSEGDIYTVEGYTLEGNLILPAEEFKKKIDIKPGDTFSRQKILDAEKAITSLLGDQGYMFATVSVRPEINDAAHKVRLAFVVKPGKRAYVRQITFSDNNKTNDVVFRREVEQMEAAPASTSLLEASKHRLQLLPYIKEVEMTVRPVANIDDQVDVNYKVKEDSSAQATFKVGYSQVQKVILGAGLNQKNFMGTGNTLGINLQRSNFEQTYAIDYTDPYYTVDGISRSFNFAVSRVNPSQVANISNGYITNEYDLGVAYGIPVGQERGVFNRIHVGASYQDTLIKIVSRRKTSNQVLSYINQHGRRSQVVDLKLGYSRDSRDKAIFPTSGVLQTLFFDGFLPVSSRSVGFYTASYHGKWYQPLYKDQFILLTKGDFAYGNGFHGASNYPFFRNFFAGGIDSVRGYQGYTLGPLDSKGHSYGGNLLADASVALIFPNYLSDSLRTSVFFDAGNVYSTANNRRFGGQSTNAGPIRYSVGIEADLMTPFGPIEISLAEPLNPQPKDEKERFQFSLGANF